MLEANQEPERTSCLIGWLHICGQYTYFLLTRTQFTDLDVQLQGHRSDVGVEVECGGGAAAQPVGHVFGVGQR